MTMIARRIKDSFQKRWMIAPFTHRSFCISPPSCYKNHHHDDSNYGYTMTRCNNNSMVQRTRYLVVSNPNHRFFSTTTTTTTNHNTDNPFWNAINVYLIQEEENDERVSVLKQFPEYTSKQIMDWERMYQILQTTQQYQKECHLLSYVLAYYYGPIQGQWNIAIDTYLLSSNTISHERLLLESLWNSGRYQTILNQTGPSLLLSQQQQQQQQVETKNILFQASIYNAMALSSIMTTVAQEDTDDFFHQAKDYLLQSKSLLLDNNGNQSLLSPLAIIESNLIILQILSSLSSSSSSSNHDLSIQKDTILSQWEQQLANLNHTKNDEMIQIQIWTCMVQYLLTYQEKVSQDDLQLASKYAKQALDMASSNHHNTVLLGRALWCVSQCFARTGTTAITAEGLYQSCLDACSSSSSYWQQVLLDACVQQSYGTFLESAYEENKRSSEANMYKDKSNSILSTLHQFQNKNHHATTSTTNFWKQNAWYSYLSFCIDGSDTIRNTIFNQSQEDKDGI